MATAFGKFVRKIRIDRNELLGEMAKSVGVTTAYLSAVENGKKKVTDPLIEKVVKHFSLDEQSTEELKEAAHNSPVSVRVDLSNASDRERMLATAFARKVHQLTPSQQDYFINALNGTDPKERT